eukprot:CAMPEP_0206538692 /NCGR_PEP_ID=MMETSP0325_2-20121206/8023_1 /ASSEMBLY_ACC=CAM_ASM_000347 /TAXON_ID=2866 /ORGANISM="Crypthecodinium cohnii, Strain Seligo" /LENGTH=198 /DNA_ID=CAMNT_0054036197 /DNA_START=295 /DNA_END=892 /DNA_ORIENTATION=-
MYTHMQRHRCISSVKRFVHLDSDPIFCGLLLLSEAAASSLGLAFSFVFASSLALSFVFSLAFALAVLAFSFAFAFAAALATFAAGGIWQESGHRKQLHAVDEQLLALLEAPDLDALGGLERKAKAVDGTEDVVQFAHFLLVLQENACIEVRNASVGALDNQLILTRMHYLPELFISSGGPSGSGGRAFPFPLPPLPMA